MLKINLEKELIAQNKKIATPEELLIVRELEKQSGEVNFNTLNKVGIHTLSEGKATKNKINRLKDETLKFNQDRVFHISQIESICNKYYLKFLPSAMYKGSVDNELALKIEAFELNHGVNCFSKMESYLFRNIAVGNTYIIAPPESFDLQEKPLDPLFFYKINDEYFYLIHKWGNDLSLLNRIKSICSGLIFFIAFWLSITLSMVAYFGNPLPLFIIVVAFLYGPIRAIMYDMSPDDAYCFYPKNDYDSPYND